MVPQEDEGVHVPRYATARGKQLSFPSDEEYRAGYIWGMDAVFDAPIDQIRSVQNVETNHRCLLDKRVKLMYHRLAGPDEPLVTCLTLRPLAYIVKEPIGLDGQMHQREVKFRADRAVQEFEAAYLRYIGDDPVAFNMRRMDWLRNYIIWEPVDGQHIVAACKQAQMEERNGLMSTEAFNKTYAQWKAQFIVFNNPQLYIEASVRINAKEFERRFYTTLYEDMVKLRAIWDACGRPNPEVRSDDAQRTRAIAMSASALHWTVSLVGKSESLGKMAKRMLEITRHAWHEDDECYKAVLQVCKDYEEGLLWYSKEDEKKWQTYAKKHSLDPNVDVRQDRRRMEQLWLRPLSRVPKQQYLRLARSMAAHAVVDGTRRKQKYYFNKASSPNPPKQTLAWVVDRIQRQAAVRNAVRWMLVESGSNNQSQCQISLPFR